MNQSLPPSWLQEGRPPRVIVIGMASKANVAESMARLARLLERHSEVRCVSLEQDLQPLPGNLDFAVVVGGDGSILRTARLLGERQIPILGVNLGRLGFMAALQPTEAEPYLLNVVAQGCPTRSHLMLECEHWDGEQLLFKDLVINEVTVRSGPPYCLLDLDLHVDQEWVTTYSADGLIISTPVGSTAHSLSAGGPILRKELDAVVITPISPHALTNRPVVDSARREYTLTRKESCQSAAVVIDGREVGTLETHQKLVIRANRERFQLFDVPGHDYYRNLREKLRWGGGVRN